MRNLFMFSVNTLLSNSVKECTILPKTAVIYLYLTSIMESDREAAVQTSEGAHQVHPGQGGSDVRRQRLLASSHGRDRKYYDHFLISLLNGCTAKDLNRLQNPQNKAAAHLIYCKRKYTHTTLLLNEWHWLDVNYCVKFKSLVLNISRVKLPVTYVTSSLFLGQHMKSSFPKGVRSIFHESWCFRLNLKILSSSIYQTNKKEKISLESG